jgi:hypothetical protein
MPRPSVSLHDIAPRLARARDAYIVEQIRLRTARRRLRHDQLAAERLVAHRELQLVRAQATGRGPYIAQRQRKLAAAQRELVRVNARRVA